MNDYSKPMSSSRPVGRNGPPALRKTGSAIDKVTRRVTHSAARQWAVALLAFVLAYGGGLWMHILHELEGATERYALPSAVHYLRDATLLLPLMLATSWAALWLTRRWYERGGRQAAHLAVSGLAALSAALLASLVMGAASPLHDITFGAQHSHHAAQPLWLHVANHGLLSLAANLPIALLACALLGARLWQPGPALRIKSPLRSPIARRARRVAIALAMMVTMVVPQLGAGTQSVQAAGICPANAPAKTFDVSAIEVNPTGDKKIGLWLNRFGDHDPFAQMYVLNSMKPAVEAQVRAGPSSLSIGLRDDPLQPLAIRANEGDCVTINFTNSTTRPAPQGDTSGQTTNNYGMHIDGLAFQMSSSGDNIGNNGDSAVVPGGTKTYTYYIPSDRTLEGAHYIHPGPGNRQAVAHGLFGTLSVEPPGSTYLNMTTGQPLLSGWEAIIVPGTGKSFRENVKLFHEIGNDSEGSKVPLDINGNNLPLNDPHTGSYRPGSRAINYRSEPFMDRLNFFADQKAVVYGAYTFADTTNIIPRGYLGDPTKFRLVHGGSEVFHVYHLHGGSDRWRFNPMADPTYDYGQTGLDKHPVEVQSQSARLDSQSMGPGESFDLEIENGAGGAQQGAGEFLFHCHIAHHYFSGMWGYWRVYDTLQPDLMPLPDRAALPQAVDSSALLGKTISGVDANGLPVSQAITAQNLDAWIRPQLPTQGVTHDINVNTKDTADQDASVWDWTVDPTTGLYLGEPDRTTNVSLGGQNVLWPDYDKSVANHPAALIVDQVGVQSTYLLNGSKVTFNNGGYLGAGARPKLLFNPTNGRPAWPLVRPHIGKRPPFSPNGHSGAPYLGEYGGQPASTVLPVGTTSTQPIDPWANRRDGICPAGAPLRTYNIVGIAVPIQVTKPGASGGAGGSNVVDENGALDVLAQDKDAVYANTKIYAGVQHNEPLAIRGNIGDCIAVTYTSELTDGNPELPYSKTNIHIHHVQFDTQASDGVISGFSFEQSIRPYKIVDPQLSSPTKAGDDVLSLTSVAKFQVGVWIAVGMGLESIEIRQIQSISTNGGKAQLKLAQKLNNAHAAAEWAGTEFVQYRWYPDVELDNIFFHDHVNGIHGWSHGMVGQLVIEPTGSRYFDPVTGAEIRAGAIADIHTDPACVPTADKAGAPSGTSNQCALIPGVVDGSYREFVLWTINDHEPSPAEATFNLRADPWKDRTSDPTLRFSSNSPQGDPYTPLPKAYVGDNFVIRNINVGQGTNTLSIDGHRTYWEPRYRDALGVQSSPIDTIHTTVSEKYTLILDGGAGGPRHVPGDYIYHDGENRRFQNGAWGIIRVLPSLNASLLRPLPGTSIAAGGPAPAQVATCPAGAPVHNFAISAVDLPLATAGDGRSAAFVPTSQAAAVKAGTVFPQPLVMHIAAGECLNVTLTNERAIPPLAVAPPKVSFHVGGLLRDMNSTGINVGTNPDQMIAGGASRTYTFYADNPKLESVMVSDFGGDNSGLDGLYGAIVVAPAGSTFSDPESGQTLDVGSQVDVHVPNQIGHRDFTTLLADHDPIIGQSSMPYPANVSGPALINYRTAGQRADDANMFSSAAHGDPTTPILHAYAGDPVKVHVLVAPASDQVHVFSLGGMSWPGDMYITNANQWQSRAVGPWEKIDLLVSGGAGGAAQQPGDFFYGDLKRPFTEAGMWGLFRVLPNNCSTGGTAGLLCLGQAVTPPPAPTVTSVTPNTGSTNGGTPVAIAGTDFDTASGGTTVNFVAPGSIATQSNAATNVSCSSTTSCTATSPAGSAGKVDVHVTVRGVQSPNTSADAFTYVAPTLAPTATSVTPNSGDVRGGTFVTVAGTNFGTTAGATSFTFGGAPATGVSCASTISCTATTPPGAAGPVTVTVTVATLSGSLANGFTYVAPAPIVSTISPTFGPTGGGTVVIITGGNFSASAGATAVKFGANAATSVTCTTTNSCTATSPAGTGVVDVIVTVGGQSSALSTFDRFTYVAPVNTLVNVAVPALNKGFGYWFVIASSGAGTINATWTTPTNAKGTLAIYAGNPFAGKVDPVKLSPPAGALATNTGNKTSFAATTASQPAGTYTVYFFTNTSEGASTGTVTYMK